MKRYFVCCKRIAIYYSIYVTVIPIFLVYLLCLFMYKLFVRVRRFKEELKHSKACLTAYQDRKSILKRAKRKKMKASIVDLLLNDSSNNDWYEFPFRLNKRETQTFLDLWMCVLSYIYYIHICCIYKSIFVLFFHCTPHTILAYECIKLKWK